MSCRSMAGKPLSPIAIARSAWVVAWAAAFGCSAALAATPLVFQVTGNVESGKPVVHGVTNLPNGTVLMATLERADRTYLAQDKFSVQGGRFKSMQFTSDGGPLPPGKYQLEVMAPVTAVQPVSARVAIGDNYSKYAGPLLKKGKFGTVLKYESTLLVPQMSKPAGGRKLPKPGNAARPD